MSDEIVLVYTARGRDRILSDGGSQAWVLDPNRVLKCQFVVCVQNRHNGAWGGADHQHGEGFLVGRISGVIPSKEGEGRWLIQFKEFAEISIPNCWGGWRNPVRYEGKDTFEFINDIEFKDLIFSPLPSSQPSSSHAENTTVIRPLTIAEAKRGLALGLGVPESAISITISM
ncbi:hypothetical protein [Azospirillum humicireducens]|uniref:hypothetical protein n=1 Tax=Azospirillum humicireducens TaxID=1226968 RepID=UPI0011B28C3F|nr:hypothetical protein [Azospirillum humicireducens]